MNPRVFTAYSQPLALDPRAFGMVIMEPPEPPKVQYMDGGLALVEVQGPLMHHADPCADSYDSIKGRVLEAIESGATKIVLSIDSPGGLVSGCFDTADEIRAVCDDRRVELYAYVDGTTASAAYALACVASKVFVPPAGIVGSIGVIDALIDETVRDRAMGLSYTVVASGSRKTDGQSHSPTTEAAVVAAQARVNSLATVFFNHVSRYRSVPADRVASLQAALFVGGEAVASGLADGVASLDQVLALVRSGADVAAASAQSTLQQETSTMDEHEKAYRASLQAVIDDEEADAKAKAKAKAVLAAMDGEPDGDETKEESKAEGDDGSADDKEHKEPDGDEAKAAAGASARATEESRLDRIERRQIMAYRPDLNEAQRAALALVPVSALESALRAIPRATAKPAASVVVGGTRGEGQGSNESARTPESLTMAQAMGLAPVGESGVVRKGSTIFFHAQSAKAGAR